MTVALSAPPTRTVTVDYETIAGTAEDGADFGGRSGTLVFTAGQTAPRTISIPIRGDRLDEDAETFEVRLREPIGVTLGDPNSVVTIVDNDPTPTLALSASASVPESGSVPITLTLSAPTGRPVAVPYGTVADSATAGVDFIARSGTAVLAPGATSTTVTVNVTPDTMWEDDERFFVDFTGVGRFIATITNDDPFPTLVGDATSARETPGRDVPGQLRFRLSNPSAWPISFHAYVFQDPARNHGEFWAAPEIAELDDATGPAVTDVTIPAGQTVGALAYAVHDDDIHEGDEVIAATVYEVTVRGELHDIEAARAGLRIISDDAAPAITYDPPVGVEGTDLVVTANLSRPTELIAFELETAAGGTADRFGDDFTDPGDVPFTFDASGRTGTARLHLTTDNLDEGEETFLVKIFNAHDLSVLTTLTARILDARGRPVNSEPPVISPQTLRTGHVARCGTGDWLRGPTSFGYQWTRGGTNIAGATGAAYTTTAADENKVVGCRVHASNGEGTSQAALAAGVLVQPKGGVAGEQTSSVTLQVAPGQALPVAAGGQVQVPVGCAAQVQRCTGDVQLQANVGRAKAAAVTVLGRAKYALKGGQTKLVKVAIARKLVTRRGLKATLVVRTTAGETQTIVSRKVLLKK